MFLILQKSAWFTRSWYTEDPYKYFYARFRRIFRLLLKKKKKKPKQNKKKKRRIIKRILKAMRFSPDSFSWFNVISWEKTCNLSTCALSVMTELLSLIVNKEKNADVQD